MKRQELYNPKRDREESGNIGATNVGGSIDFLFAIFLPSAGK